MCYLEVWEILKHCHSEVIGGHFRVNLTIEKVLEVGFFKPSLLVDAKKFVKTYDQCQQTGNLSKRDEMKQPPI